MTFPGFILDLTFPEPYGCPLSPRASSTPFLLLLAPRILSAPFSNLLSFLIVSLKSRNTPRTCILTICALRYICAWLAVRAGEDVLPKSTACWARPEAVAEFTLCARLMSWAAAGEAARLS